MKRVRGALRFVLVTVGIIVLTSFSIDATDSFRTSQTALGILAGSVTNTVGCESGTAEVMVGDVRWCVDQYENSTGGTCPHGEPRSTLETQDNVAAVECLPVSEEAQQPWTYVTYHQAKELCAKKGTQLLSNKLWYEAALRTPDQTNICVLNDRVVAVTGSSAQCQSVHGVYDLVGNVWEWVDGQVVDGQYDGRTQPEEGYVYEADIYGVPTVTTSTKQTLFNDDYYWGDERGTYAMMRGGYYAIGDDGGVYSIHAKVAPSFSSGAIGFRCGYVL